MKKFKCTKGLHLVLKKVFCDWCKKEILKEGYLKNKKILKGSSFSIVFNYGSDFDGRTFDFDVCDDCFKKFLLKKAPKERFTFFDELEKLNMVRK